MTCTRFAELRGLESRKTIDEGNPRLPVIVLTVGQDVAQSAVPSDFEIIDLNHMPLIAEVLPISTDERQKPRMSPVSRTITIIDDDTAVLDSTQFLLEVYDFEVLTYRSGHDFLAEDPDVACLIVDYQMPGMNGLEFLTQLRKLGNEVPAIMITATVSPTLQRQAAELGIKRVLEKPLSNHELLRAIEEELRQP